MNCLRWKSTISYRFLRCNSLFTHECMCIIISFSCISLNGKMIRLRALNFTHWHLISIITKNQGAIFTFAMKRCLFQGFWSNRINSDIQQNIKSLQNWTNVDVIFRFRLTCIWSSNSRSISCLANFTCSSNRRSYSLTKLLNSSEYSRLFFRFSVVSNTNGWSVDVVAVSWMVY